MRSLVLLVVRPTTNDRKEGLTRGLATVAAPPTRVGQAGVGSNATLRSAGQVPTIGTEAVAHTEALSDVLEGRAPASSVEEDLARAPRRAF